MKFRFFKKTWLVLLGFGLGGSLTHANPCSSFFNPIEPPPSPERKIAIVKEALQDYFGESLNLGALDAVAVIKESGISSKPKPLNALEVRKIAQALLRRSGMNPENEESQSRLLKWFTNGLKPDENAELGALFVRSPAFMGMLKELLALGLVETPSLLERFQLRSLPVLEKAQRLQLWGIARSIFLNYLLYKVNLLSPLRVFIPSLLFHKLSLGIMDSKNAFATKNLTAAADQLSRRLGVWRKLDLGIGILRKTFNSYVLITLAVFAVENKDLVGFAIRSAVASESDYEAYEKTHYEQKEVIKEQYLFWKTAHDATPSVQEIATELVLFGNQEKDGILRAFPETSSTPTRDLSRDEWIELLLRCWQETQAAPPTAGQILEMRFALFLVTASE